MRYKYKTFWDVFRVEICISSYQKTFGSNHRARMTYNLHYMTYGGK